MSCPQRGSKSISSELRAPGAGVKVAKPGKTSRIQVSFVKQTSSSADSDRKSVIRLHSEHSNSRGGCLAFGN